MGVLKMNFVKRISMLLLMIISILLIAGATHPHRQSQRFIRFHVIANSDSHEDQKVKLMVRDRLLAEFGAELEKSQSLTESRHIISEKIEDIERAAKMEVDRYLPGYNVKATLGYFDFPTKAYGNLVLPAGSYEALRVVIGKGEGANWWCVMFPPLCFVDITHGVAKDDGDAISKDDENVISKENKDDRTVNGLYSFNSMNSNDEDNVKIEYRFKFIEWWEKAKNLLNTNEDA